MKKILSLLVFLSLLVWTWNVIHSTEAVGFETHTAIQEKIAELIKENLQTKKPQSQNLIFTRLWTENLEGNKVRAVFSYRFQETLPSQDKTDQTIDGEAVLVRQPSDDPSIDNWKLIEMKATGDTVTYQEGSTVSAEETDSSTEAPTEKPESVPDSKPQTQ